MTPGSWGIEDSKCAQLRFGGDSSEVQDQLQDVQQVDPGQVDLFFLLGGGSLQGLARGVGFSLIDLPTVLFAIACVHFCGRDIRPRNKQPPVTLRLHLITCLKFPNVSFYYIMVLYQKTAPTCPYLQPPKPPK